MSNVDKLQICTEKVLGLVNWINYNTYLNFMMNYVVQGTFDN